MVCGRRAVSLLDSLILRTPAGQSIEVVDVRRPMAVMFVKTNCGSDLHNPIVHVYVEIDKAVGREFSTCTVKMQENS